MVISKASLPVVSSRNPACLRCRHALLGLGLVLMFGTVSSWRLPVMLASEPDGGIADAAVSAKDLPPPLKAYKGREIALTMHYEGAPG